jgi:hypothetical protein
MVFTKEKTEDILSKLCLFFYNSVPTFLIDEKTNLPLQTIHPKPGEHML